MADLPNAATATGNPLRSSSRPTNSSFVPSPRSAGSASANRPTSAPFGTISNAPPIRAAAARSATRDTAMRTTMRRAVRLISGAAAS